MKEELEDAHIGTLTQADFDYGTMLFKIEGDMKVRSGKYRIVHIDNVKPTES